MSTITFIRRAAREELLACSNKPRSHRKSHAAATAHTPKPPSSLSFVVTPELEHEKKDEHLEAACTELVGAVSRTPTKAAAVKATPAFAASNGSVLQHTIRWSETMARHGLRSPAISPIRGRAGVSKYHPIAADAASEVLENLEKTRSPHTPSIEILGNSGRSPALSVRRVSNSSQGGMRELQPRRKPSEHSKDVKATASTAYGAKAMHADKENITDTNSSTGARFVRRGRLYKSNAKTASEAPRTPPRDSTNAGNITAAAVPEAVPGPISNDAHLVESVCQSLERGDARQLGAALKAGLVHPDAHNLRGERLIMVASRSGCDSGIRLLISFGVDLNCVDMEGNTPLHAAAHGGHRATFRLLTLFGSDDSVVNTKGRTCYQLLR